AQLPLPYAGLMTDLPPQEAAARLGEVTAAARSLGCRLPYPVTTLSFLGLSVIPALKLTPRGLLDVTAWRLLDGDAPGRPAQSGGQSSGAPSSVGAPGGSD
ncbi:adenine deaminase C-terminal domain-containing protein, partial [uncultured Deinococcus sp.]|uniref:adenine deaminase C-terminal domain-containing protein n=1 Tax=uncultured Deinococcus sp. TaxID=158789 RepID=UPI00258A265F